MANHFTREVEKKEQKRADINTERQEEQKLYRLLRVDQNRQPEREEENAEQEE